MDPDPPALLNRYLLAKFRGEPVFLDVVAGCQVWLDPDPGVTQPFAVVFGPSSADFIWLYGTPGNTTDATVLIGVNGKFTAPPELLDRLAAMAALL